MRRWTTSSHPAQNTHPRNPRGRRMAMAAASALVATGLTAGSMAGVVSSAHAAEPFVEQAPTTAGLTDVVSKQVAAARVDQAARATAVRTAVVAKAMAQVGDDYVAGATGPNAFDCSGLVVYAWKTAGGVSLEHYSYDQYKATQRISVKDAVPGDLAFYFKNGAHHVGIYIGDGKIVNASDYGIGVIVSPLLSGWGKEHFSGMGRVKLPA